MLIAILAVSGAAFADWDVGDDHKMHFPQLPDPTGWDIDLTQDAIQDDFLCSWSGPINDVHFWVSWEGDNTGGPTNISWIDIGILADVASGDPSNNLSYSHPEGGLYGGALWAQRFLPGQFTSRYAGTGDQGWAEPANNIWRRPDHQDYYQINIDDISAVTEPFIQEKDTVYWLAIHIGVEDYANTKIGWKTSLDHWNDDAVYYLADEQHPYGWRELIDPDTGSSLDMAFVITPEPATICMFALGGLALRRRKR